jgi:hypothetical protein
MTLDIIAENETKAFSDRTKAALSAYIARGDAQGGQEMGRGSGQASS